MGLWYEIERNPIIFELLSKCENATYTDKHDGTLGVYNQAVVEYTGYYNISGYAKVKDPSDPAALEVIFYNPRKMIFLNCFSSLFN